MGDFGNRLYRRIDAARGALFQQGQLAQLTYGAFDIAAAVVKGDQNENIEITYPIGWQADRPINSTGVYKKDDLLRRYEHLAYHQLAVNSIISFVTIAEAAIGEIVRIVVLKYPQKLGMKRTIPMQTVLESASIEDIHLRATDAFLHELFYKSPIDLASELKQILSCNFLECPAYHKYLEIKATRDIYIHNQGVANETYVRKAGTHLRAQPGISLSMDPRYLLESYEACLQMTEWIEKELHDHWHSSELEERQLSLKLTSPAATPSLIQKPSEHPTTEKKVP